jgi:hypothetical protein
MRRKLAAVVAAQALIIIGGAAVAGAVNAAPVSTVANVPAWVLLPACDEDAPDPMVGDIRCVWEDDGTYWVVGQDQQQDYQPCATEDSVSCVWDSGDVDSPRRFVVNSAQQR